MPIDHGYGYSDYTIEKQRHFRSVLEMHMRICRGILSRSRRYDGKYHYFDLNAGPGLYDIGGVQPGLFDDPIGDCLSMRGQMPGSPLIFLDAAKHFGLDYQATFFEINKCHYETLCSNVARRAPTGQVEIRNGDSSQLLPTCLTHDHRLKLGLIYTDPTGKVPPFDVLAYTSHQMDYREVDILIACSATNIKRIRRAFPDKAQSLSDYLRAIRKNAWIVREPIGRHQWTLLVGSNWANFPQWEKEGFYSITSPQGKAILDRLHYTSKELEDMNGRTGKDN